MGLKGLLTVNARPEKAMNIQHQPRTGDVIPELSEGLKRSFLNIDGFGKPLKSPVPIRLTHTPTICWVLPIT